MGVSVRTEAAVHAVRTALAEDLGVAILIVDQIDTFYRASHSAVIAAGKLVNLCCFSL